MYRSVFTSLDSVVWLKKIHNHMQCWSFFLPYQLQSTYDLCFLRSFYLLVLHVSWFCTKWSENLFVSLNLWTFWTCRACATTIGSRDRSQQRLWICSSEWTVYYFVQSHMLFTDMLSDLLVCTTWACEGSSNFKWEVGHCRPDYRGGNTFFQ